MAGRKVKERATVPEVTGRPRLGQVARDLGTAVVEVIEAPVGLDVTVTEPMIYDRLAPAPVQPGDIVLGVGAAGRDALDLVREAAAGRAAAVALKLSGDAETLREAARACGVALLGVAHGVTWDQLHALVRTAVASTGEVPGNDPGAVRVGDLFALANAVASMVGGPVTIEDPQSRVLAYSSLDDELDQRRLEVILRRRMSPSGVKRFRDDGTFRKLWSTRDVVRVDPHPEEGLRARLIIAVRAGEEILGSIWVQQGPKPFGRAAEQALREAASIAALHLIRHRTMEDFERRMRGDLVRSILFGRGQTETLASSLGIDPRVSCAVIAFQLQASDELEIALQRERVLQLVTVHCEAFRRRAAAVVIEATVFGLLHDLTRGTQPKRGAAPEIKQQLVSLARDIVERAEAMRVALLAGVGSVVPNLREAPRSRSEAEQVLRVLAKGTAGSLRVADVERVRGQAVLVELEDIAAERPHIRLGKVQLLAEHDADRSTSYVATLRAYLDHPGDIPRAAARLSVHPNTFRYRLRRLVALSGIDLDDPDERLVTQLQLRFLP